MPESESSIAAFAMSLMVIRPSSLPSASVMQSVTTWVSCIFIQARFKDMLRSTPGISLISISFTCVPTYSI